MGRSKSLTLPLDGWKVLEGIDVHAKETNEERQWQKDERDPGQPPYI